MGGLLDIFKITFGWNNIEKKIWQREGKHMKLLCLLGHKTTKEKMVKYVNFVPMYQMKTTCSRCAHVKLHLVKRECMVKFKGG